MVETAEDIGQWITAYTTNHTKKTGHVLTVMASAAESIHRTYSDAVRNFIQPRMASGMTPDRHKRASAMEAAIAAVGPIQHPSVQGSVGSHNAALAFSCGKIIVTRAWDPVPVDPFFLKEENFERNHVELLTVTDIENFPFFYNACAWYLFEELVRERYRSAHRGELVNNEHYV